MDGERCVSWCPVCRSAELLQASAGPEARAQWHSIQRNGLIVLRELLDSYIGQLEASGREPEPDPEPSTAPESEFEFEFDPEPPLPMIGPSVEFEPLDDELAAIYRSFSHS